MIAESNTDAQQLDADPAWEEAARAHSAAILAEHPNFIELAQEPAFGWFCEALGAQAIVDSGTAAEVNDLFSRYKVVRPTPEQLKAAQDKVQRVLHAPGLNDAEPDLIGDRANLATTSHITAEKNPREWHALRALMRGPKSREEIDRAACVSNGPDLIMDLRRRFGLACECRRVNHIDAHGRKVKKGIYYLTGQDHQKVARLLRNDGAASAADSIITSDAGGSDGI